MSEPKSPRDELNDLLDEAVASASERLEADGEFDPFAVAVRSDGSIALLEADLAEGEEADAEQIVLGLRETLHAQRAELRASAVVADVTIEDEAEEAMSAAIAVQMEHVADDPVTFYLPYELNGDALELGELVGEPGEGHVFPKPLVN